MNVDDIIYKIIGELEKYKDTKDDIEILNDIYTINMMINDITMYNVKVVDDIRNKYQSEMDFLYSLHSTIYGNYSNNHQSVRYEDLVARELRNVRHTLLRVQALRLLNRKGKKMAEQDLINDDNDIFYIKFVEAML